MTILVVGASGATGRLLVKQLLDRGQTVKAVVRYSEKLPEDIRKHDRLSVIQASISNLSDDEMTRHVSDCHAAASCLGRNLRWKGLFGPPRRLVTDAVRQACRAFKANDQREPVRFALMNTAGNSNRDLHEPTSMAQKAVVGLLRLLLPPHADNEDAADYLRTEIGQNDEMVEWTAVRPDSLIDEEEITDYKTHPSPIRSAIFDPGKTSRINVAAFMADLITDDDLWRRWKGRMPVIYNRPST